MIHTPIFQPVPTLLHKPTTGDIVSVRTRHYVVENASYDSYGTVRDLARMDDDAQLTSIKSQIEAAPKDSMIILSLLTTSHAP